MMIWFSTYTSFMKCTPCGQLLSTAETRRSKNPVYFNWCNLLVINICIACPLHRDVYHISGYVSLSQHLWMVRGNNVENSVKKITTVLQSELISRLPPRYQKSYKVSGSWQQLTVFKNSLHTLVMCHMKQGAKHFSCATDLRSHSGSPPFLYCTAKPTHNGVF